jgi:hypothetical protein
VLSKHPIKGVGKGGTVTLTARPGAIQSLLTAGAIEPVRDEPVSTDVKKAPVKVAEKKVAE